jgi:nitroimidazol reductase NimA-like FMN-containing flavoprotein (pyridoxamine 5'-phosphate oxidase superfamily)
MEPERKMPRALTQCLRKFPQILTNLHAFAQQSECDWRNRDCRFLDRSSSCHSEERISRMFIHELTYRECSNILRHSSVGRLACARDNQPYVVPIHFDFNDTYVYGFTTLGQKIEWMRSNPLVCLEVDEEISAQQWTSIVIFGRYEELTDTPEHLAARTHAYTFLQKRAMWWEPAYISPAHRDQPHSLTPIFYRIHIDKMTGHRATLNGNGTAHSVTQTPTIKRGWLHKLFNVYLQETTGLAKTMLIE